MDKQTLKALQGSIVKWEKIVHDGAVDAGDENCPLCKRFMWRDCSGCPIAASTGKSYCNGSPYREWLNVFDQSAGFTSYHPDTPFVIDDATHDAAKAELAFIKSLLP